MEADKEKTRYFLTMPFPSLSRLHESISTPALLIDAARMDKNLRGMQAAADARHVALRPHIKTHKAPVLARRQRELGARGLTVAKLSEAELFAGEGFDDIFMANQLTQKAKAPMLNKVRQRARLILGIDHPRQVTLLEEMLSSPGPPLEVRIEIDSGFHRCGIEPESDLLVDVARLIRQSPALTLEGVFTHAGQAYGARSPREIKDIAAREAASVTAAAARLKKIGIEIATISVGSTPTAKEVIRHKGVTEVRPGNYIFYDRIQHALGSCRAEQLALYVLATVIAQPGPAQIVCDAGSKTLNVETGAHGMHLVKGYGQPMNVKGTLTRLSEEHGIIRLERPEEIAIGSPLLIAPNHACVVANLYDFYHLADGESVQIVPISARGKSR